MNDYVQYAELSEEEQARLEDEADRENDERRIERIAAERPAPDDRGGPQDYDAYLDRLADDREAERIERRLRSTLPTGTTNVSRGGW